MKFWNSEDNFVDNMSDVIVSPSALCGQDVTADYNDPGPCGRSLHHFCGTRLTIQRTQIFTACTHFSYLGTEVCVFHVLSIDRNKSGHKSKIAIFKSPYYNWRKKIRRDYSSNKPDPVWLRLDQEPRLPHNGEIIHARLYTSSVQI